MSRHLTDEERRCRDEFIMTHHETMDINELAKHFDVATSTVRAVCLRLGVKSKAIPRQGKGRIALPTIGVLSGPMPTSVEMREFNDADPRLDPCMDVFLG